MEDKKILLIEKTQNVITEMFNLCYDRYEKLNYAKYITERLNARYAYLSSLFSEVKGITLQQFIIEFKINKVKELLLQGLKPTDISYQLGYSSIAHLSNQFKKTTGNTLSSFRSSMIS